jgi:hypothetical protein
MKGVKDLYNENNKTLRKELRRTQESGNISCIHRLGKSKFPSKIPMVFITELEKAILKFTWNQRKSQMLKMILCKINQ